MTIREALRRSPIYRPYTTLKYRWISSAREGLFTGYSRDNIWGDPESVSGTGSSLAQTAHLREEIPALLRTLGVRSLLDVPCGDFTWMRHVDLAGIDYVGGDIVGEMVSRLQAEHGRPGRRFVRLDVVSDDLPTTEAVLLRDLFLHLPLAMVQRAVANLRRSGATWLLTSHYPDITNNPDIRMGEHRFPNLTLPPFGWPAPVMALDERSMTDEDRPDKQLAVWRLADLGPG